MTIQYRGITIQIAISDVHPNDPLVRQLAELAARKLFDEIDALIEQRRER